MQFSYLEKFFPKIEKLDLPGKKAQALLAPEFRQALLEKDLDFPNAKKAGVLILLYPSEDQLVNFALILRNTYKGVHSNQIAFPGGKVEKNDSTIIETAVRETEEEIGVAASTIKVLRQLTELYIPPSNFMVYPTIGAIDYSPQFVRQHDEVKQVIEVKLEDFLKRTPIETHTISTSYAHQKDVLAFNINGYTVWGATAMMLSEFKVLMNTVIN
jgi:8-oxo-dGTP pyrophosphatase MutT (NUDIX family)